jgi:bifunctional non-homologous end joining protein LigD
VTWEELGEVDRSDMFSVADVEHLLERARSRSLKGWGVARQHLPRIG